MSFAPLDVLPAVAENYRRWKGQPSHVHRLQAQYQGVLPSFEILEYREEGPYSMSATGDERYSLYCTVGASHQVIPQSKQELGDQRGMRHEFLMHGQPQYQREIANYLEMLACYPFLTNSFLSVGSVVSLPEGKTLVEGSSIDLLYLTFPYEDDRNWDAEPFGQISTSQYLVQMLWVLPIYQSEAQFLYGHGLEAFDSLCYDRRLQACDFMRKPMI